MGRKKREVRPTQCNALTNDEVIDALLNIHGVLPLLTEIAKRCRVRQGYGFEWKDAATVIDKAVVYLSELREIPVATLALPEHTEVSNG